MIELIQEALQAVVRVQQKHPNTAVDELIDALLDLHNTVEEACDPNAYETTERRCDSPLSDS